MSTINTNQTAKKLKNGNNKVLKNSVMMSGRVMQIVF